MIRTHKHRKLYLLQIQKENRDLKIEFGVFLSLCLFNTSLGFLLISFI